MDDRAVTNGQDDLCLGGIRWGQFAVKHHGRHGQSIFSFNAEVSDGAIHPGVTKKELIARRFPVFLRV